MTNTFTLDSLREETKKKYAPVVIGLSDDSEVELLSLLRLKKTAREAVLETIEDLKLLREGDDDGDLTDEERDLLVESLSNIFRTVAESRADELIHALHDEDPDIHLALMMQVLSLWLAGAQVGEARNSLS